MQRFVGVGGHEAVLAGDENVRTWWSAASGEAGEWFGMDLGRPMRIEAVQLNFAEQDVDTTRMAEDYTAYRLLASLDGEHWETVVDESRNARPIRTVSSISSGASRPVICVR